MPRLILVSNRLPVTVRVEGRRVRLTQSPGGLATGLSRYHDTADTIWIGWPGETERLREPQRQSIDAWLAEHRMVSVPLTSEEVAAYYEGYANGVLWPLFHYLPGRVPLHVNDWDAYEAANARFADSIAAHVQPGDAVWVHDYQLLRLPALLRERVPRDVKIGFFLHVPFPTSEIFRAIPQRDLLLEGMLGADLIGFHTHSYRRHFATSVVRVLGAQPELDRVDWRGRDVRLGVYPMGVDAQTFAARSAEPAIVERAAALSGSDGIKLLVGVDRLDYTKGIRRRLLAFERLLENHPELHGRVRLVQVGVPSREQVGAYRTFRRQVDESIGRINGTFGTADWTPINWIYRALPFDELVALYRAADVMLVTPVRDGMNLVSKEFVASRVDEDGVLVLSEFAGAAVELAEAVQVNPFDIDGSAEAYYRALTMPFDEQRARMHALRRRVFASDVDDWVQRFTLALTSDDARKRHSRLLTPAELVRWTLEARADRDLLLLLDYDGTLAPFASAPYLARPAPETVALLERLANTRGVTVHVVSGRTRDTLERWLGHLPIGLHAEHGVWSRGPHATSWVGLPIEPHDWYERVRAIFEEHAVNTPGALVEEKSLGLAWHYRGADPEFGAWQARELQLNLMDLLANSPVEVLAGNRVIEIRPHGLGKGLVVEAAMAEAPADALVVAVGDDHTDEDMFAALPEHGLAIHVGAGMTRADFLLAGVPEVRTFLMMLEAALNRPQPVAAEH